MPDAASEQEITITRVFDAPREAVWKAWTEPEQLAQWWGPRGWSTAVPTITMDVRPGGAFRLTSVSDDGEEMPMTATYREVVEPERLVVEEAEQGAWHGGAIVVVTFADLGDGRTEMTFRSTLRTTDEMRDRATAGTASAFDRLAGLLAERTNMNLVTGVDFAVVWVKDFDAAEEFYGTVLGLPVGARYGSMPGVEFETGNLTLAVLDAAAFGQEFHASRNPVALRVDDVEAARATLQSHGVEFTGDIVDSGVCHQAYFSDPDGNALILHHRYAPRD